MTYSYRLILQSGMSIGTEYPLDKQEVVLGRDPTNDLVINDPEVSRRHLRFVLEGTSYRIEDLGSTNGTFIQGQRITTPVLLRPGEVITLGEKIVLRFEATAFDPNATRVAPRDSQRGTQPQPVVPTPQVSPVPPVAVTPPYTPPPQNPTPVQSTPPAQNYQPIPATPAYTPQNIPAQPYISPVPAVSKKKSKGLVIVLIILGVIVLFCVVPMIIIDATQSYCSLFPGITNFITTMFWGVIGCP